MFREKLRTESPKARKKHGTAYYAVMMFTSAIEFALGTNAGYLMYQNFTITLYGMLHNELGASALTTILAFVFGSAIFVGGMWTFAGFIDNLEDARAYREAYGTATWPVALIWTGLFLVMALDFTTLLFRLTFFNEKGALSLFAFFCVLIILPPVLGPLIHVLEHTPRERRLAKVRNYVEQLDTDEIERVAREMDADLRTRWLNGDATARTEHYDRVQALRDEAYDQEQATIQERERKKAEKNRPLPLDSRRKQA